MSWIADECVGFRILGGASSTLFGWYFVESALAGGQDIEAVGIREGIDVNVFFYFYLDRNITFFLLDQ